MCSVTLFGANRFCDYCFITVSKSIDVAINIAVAAMTSVGGVTLVSASGFGYDRAL